MDSSLGADAPSRAQLGGPYAYVRQFYGVDPIIGSRVRHTEMKGPGSFGVIAKPGSAGHYVYVKFDGRKHADPCHPTALDYSPAEPVQP